MSGEVWRALDDTRRLSHRPAQTDLVAEREARARRRVRAAEARRRVAKARR